MRTARPDSSADVLSLPWPRFEAWWRARWKPGQHVALVGPTGAGKSTFAARILPARKWVLALDPKGGDSTLSTLLTRGFERVERWPPPRDVLERLGRGEPVRLVVGPVVRRRDDMARLRQALSAALDAAFDAGGWTVYVDELQVLADRRLMDLARPVERNLIAARDRGVSMVTSFQRPANVPRAASEMASWLAVWRTRDLDTVGRLAEMAGRSRAEMRGAIAALEANTVMIVGQDPHDPIVITRPPKLRA